MPRVRKDDHSTPSFRMRDLSVCGLIPSAFAAPKGPSIRPWHLVSASSMCRTIACSSVASDGGVLVSGVEVALLKRAGTKSCVPECGCVAANEGDGE